MKIENLTLDALIPYARNSRTHSDEQVAQVAASIREFGFTNPVLIDADGGIIAGHGRVMAARKLGLADVPCIRLAHLSESQKRAYVIADNKLALNSGWDEKMLALEFKDLQAMDFDLELTGFGLGDIEELLAELDATPEGNTDADQTPAVQAEVVSQPGDVWLLGKHRIMCGDSTSAEQVAVLMGGGMADMVFTDPPYGVDYEGINNDSRSGLESLLDKAFQNYAAHSKPAAPVYVFHSDRCADIFHNVFRRYCHFSSIIVWVKQSLVLSQTDYQSQHEPCIYGWLEGAPHPWHSDRKQTSVWHFDKERVDGHTTPKPVALIERALTNSSKASQVVMDLFGGSGSTLIACEKTGRINRSMELGPRYCDVIVRRWQQYTGKRATHAVTGQEFGA
ncbi:MAG: site-specific DNA-methyltransferase [Propionivibrio sp.]|nr:site-specific DNA-methyltransferase [Propionivibrio sp.]